MDTCVNHVVSASELNHALALFAVFVGLLIPLTEVVISYWFLGRRSVEAPAE